MLNSFESRVTRLIEAGAAIFKGDSVYWPEQIWSLKGQRWKPYKGDVPKEIDWGNVIPPKDAAEFMEPV